MPTRPTASPSKESLGDRNSPDQHAFCAEEGAPLRLSLGKSDLGGKQPQLHPGHNQLKAEVSDIASLQDHRQEKRPA